jgi:cation-transporting ATPase 13A3/4/5
MNIFFKTFFDEQPTSRFEQKTPIVKKLKLNEDEINLEIAIIKQFSFSSSLLRMSVLCKTLDSDHLDVYCKGAPEKITELCKPETSIFMF